jgi:molybdate transport system regulatory protein
LKSQQLSIKSRIWICTEQGTFLGEGRITLLKEIEKHGSISKAAKAMKMSYKKAWKLVDSMNRQGDQTLVRRKTGGIGGGGSELSETGKKAIELFQEISSKNSTFLNSQIEKMEF